MIHRQGTYLGCRIGPQSGHYGRQPINVSLTLMFLFLFLSLSLCLPMALPLSLKNNETYPWVRIKKNEKKKYTDVCFKLHRACNQPKSCQSLKKITWNSAERFPRGIVILPVAHLLWTPDHLSSKIWRNLKI